MTKTFIIRGTDTGIGKTMVAVMLTVALDAFYWKPIQFGIEDGTDRQQVQALISLPAERFLPELCFIAPAVAASRRRA
jgi:dethiobiotin synthetase